VVRRELRKLEARLLFFQSNKRPHIASNVVRI
jgi:sensor histidine kinase YesM